MQVELLVYINTHKTYIPSITSHINALEFGKDGVNIVKVTFMPGHQKALVYLCRMHFFFSFICNIAYFSNSNSSLQEKILILHYIIEICWEL